MKLIEPTYVLRLACPASPCMGRMQVEIRFLRLTLMVGASALYYIDRGREVLSIRNAHDVCYAAIVKLQAKCGSPDSQQFFDAAKRAPYHRL